MSTSAAYLFPEELYKITSPLLVIIAKPWHNILESEKALLAKILGSVRINIESVTIVQQEIVSPESLAVFNASKVLVFGSNVKGDLKQYEHHVLNGVSVIKADDLGNLDDAKKKSLWIAMKQMFGV